MNGRKISVYRDKDGQVRLAYPTEWDFEKIFYELCELCADLKEEADWFKQLAEVRKEIMTHYKDIIDKSSKEKENV